MVGVDMTIEGRVQALRVLDAVDEILRQPARLMMPLTELVRYCAHELDVPPELPLKLLDERLAQEDDWNEKSGVFVRTECGLLPAHAL